MVEIDAFGPDVMLEAGACTFENDRIGNGARRQGEVLFDGDYLHEYYCPSWSGA
jgi:hypothetical protein